MINIAIVEDEKKARELLISYIGRYYGGDADKFCVKEFDRAEPFVYNYKADYDIIFIDIELPGSTVWRLRSSYANPIRS